MDRLTMVVGPIPALIKSWRSSGHTDKFAPASFKRDRDFIFWENSLIRAFWYAGATVDTCIWINVVPGPLILWFALYDTLNRAYLHTASITQAEASDDIRHGFPP
jgi:hypothetical protein